MLGIQRDLALDRVLAEIGVNYFHYRLYAVLGVLLSFEYLQAIMMLSFLIPALEEEWGLSVGEEQGIAASGFAGMMIGAFLAGVIADRYGRRKTVIGSLWIAALGNILSVFAVDAITLSLTRALIGWGSGALFTGCYALFSEMFSMRDRTRHIMFVKLSFTVGSVMSVLFAWVTLGMGASFRVYLIVCAAPCVVMLFFTRQVPESPKWLLANGFTAQAQKLLDSMAALNGVSTESIDYAHLFEDIDHQEASGVFTVDNNDGGGLEEDAVDAGDVEMKEWESDDGSDGEGPEEGDKGGRERGRRGSKRRALLQVGSNHATAFSMTANVRELLCNPEFTATTVKCMFFFFLIAVTFYATSILTPQFFAGVGDDLYAMSLISTLVEVPGRLLPLLVLDTMGRKKSLVLFFALSGVSFGALSMLLTAGAADWLVAVALSCARLVGAMLMGVSYLYVLEFFPTNLRATAVGLCALCGRIGGVLAALLVDETLAGLMLGFAGCAVLGALSGASLRVETNKRIMR
jgi:putative MFS transporter